MIGSLPPADLALVFRMMALLALGTWAARPLAQRLVPGGGGWCPAVLIGWTIMGWVPWACAAVGLIAFEAAALAGLIALLAARAGFRPVPPDPRGGAVVATAFVVLFWLGLAQRLGMPDLRGLEKFTDMAFLAAAMRSDWMPPPDAWFAGATVNYYYVGQAMTGAWGHLAGAEPAAAYQIGMASLFALTGLAVWRLTVALAAPFGWRIAQVLGGAATVLTLYGGNLHSALYSLFHSLMPTTKEAFYFPDSTRFIGFDPPTGDKGFTEFIAYAFAAGDLHAHVVATPVFLLGLLVLLAMLQRGRAGQAPDLMQAGALGWVLGLCIAINSWDVAILGLLAAMVALVLAIEPGPQSARRLDRLGAAAVVALGVAFVTAAPFLGTFTPFASGIEAAPARTPIWQLLVLYGHALPAGLLFAALLLWRRVNADGLAIGLVLVGALILIALTETMIVRDIYDQDYARANTMFKLSFRAQNLLIMAALAALAPAVARGGVWMTAALAAAVPLVATLAYAPHVFQPPSVVRSLDGLAFLGDERALVEAAGRLSLAPGESLIEASGDAFGDTGRVSAMTGLPAVLGWAGHEWLWRNDATAALARADRVRVFFTTADPVARCAVIRLFSIRYVILGQIEMLQYPDLQTPAILALGPVIHDDAGGRIVQIARDQCP